MDMMLSRDAANCAAPWWRSENDLIASIEDDIAIGAIPVSMTPYQKGYLARNAETFDERDALYLEIYPLGHRAQVEFVHGSNDAELDNLLSEGIVVLSPSFNNRVSIEQAQYLF